MSPPHLTPTVLASAWPTISLVIFLVLFIGIVIYDFAVPNSIWKKDAQLPLADGDREEHEKRKPHD